MSKTNISWTQEVWNPVTGCTKISDGCTHCYAERMAKRLKAMGNIRYVNEFKVTLHEDLINKPYTWKKTRKVFVNSMSDLFHEEVPDDFIMKVFKTMNETPHQYQILTKRSKRLAEIAPKLTWTDNIWIGVSVENDSVLNRIEDLVKIPAKIRFLSVEPLLGPIDNINLNGIHWVIVGGESGSNSRLMKEEWALAIRDKCLHDNVPFYFKQWGGSSKEKGGKILDGQIWENYPEY